MSYDEKPEFQALQQLEAMVKQVTKELAVWRRRAHAAEAIHDGAPGRSEGRDRVQELEGENEELRERVQQVRRRVVELLERLRFLEEQASVVDGRR